jgi:peptidoglycan/xylan/chitin deacetylase (PgdA/CDA1 family)
MLIRSGLQLLKKSLSPFFSGMYEGIGQIIVLHRITPEANRQRLHNTGLEITQEHLEEIIIFFKKREYDFITLDDLSDYLIGNYKRKFVIFTLDDGYVDNLTHGYPIFNKYNVPFTIYITTNFPDRKAILWWYLLEDLLLLENRISFTFGNKDFSFNTQNYCQKVEVFNILRNFIKAYHGPDQIILIHTLFSKYGIQLYDKVEELALSWQQIIELNQDPLVTIAAHTVTHPAFKALEDFELLNEVNMSVQILESKLNIPVKHFAYPYGSAMEVGKREAMLIKQTGIKTATTGMRGNIMQEHINNLHALPRLYIGPETTENYLTNFISGKIPFNTGARKRVVTV